MHQVTCSTASANSPPGLAQQPLHQIQFGASNFRRNLHITKERRINKQTKNTNTSWSVCTEHNLCIKHTIYQWNSPWSVCTEHNLCKSENIAIRGGQGPCWSLIFMPNTTTRTLITRSYSNQNTSPTYAQQLKVVKLETSICIKITTGNKMIAANKIKIVEHIQFHTHTAYAHHKFLWGEANLHLYIF
jgi:hypothetical protein